jgi:hypothetical protein
VPQRGAAEPPTVVWAARALPIVRVMRLLPGRPFPLGATWGWRRRQLRPLSEYAQIVNASYGLLVGIGLYTLGLPYAVLWGFLPTVLRFIP